MADVPTPPKKPSRAKWLFCREEVEHGPFTSHQLEAMATKGELLPTDFVWKEGMKKWIQADTTSLVFPVASEDATVDIVPDSPDAGTVDPDLAEFLSGKSPSKPKHAAGADRFNFLDPTESGDTADSTMQEPSDSDYRLVLPEASEDGTVNIVPESPEAGTVDPDLAEFLSGKSPSKPKHAAGAGRFNFLAPTESGDTADSPMQEPSDSDCRVAADDDALLMRQMKFAAMPGERICFQSGAAWSAGIATHSGTIFLTTRRIVFCQPDGFDAGLLLIHTFNLLTKQHDQIVWQVLLPDIVVAHRKKYLGFGRKTVVTARDGRNYTVVVQGEAWRAAWGAVGITLIDGTGDPAAQPVPAVEFALEDKPVAEATGEEEWHVNVRGENNGPICYAELQRMCQACEVGADDLVWKEGMDKWALASSMPGLIPAPRKPKGPPPITEVAPLNSGTDFDSFVLQTVQTARKGVARVSHAKPAKGFHNQRVIVGIASGLGMLGTFLPWAHLPIVGTIDGTVNGDGWITLGLYAAALVCVFREPHGEMFAGGQKMVAGTCPILASLIGMYTASNVGSARRAFNDDNPFGAAIAGSIRTGFGLYLVVLAGIVIGLAVFALPDDTRSRQ